MKCVICKTGEVEPGRVEAEIKVGRDRLVVTVDAEACGECGEQYYSAAVLRELAHIERAFAAKAISPASVGTVYQVPRSS